MKAPATYQINPTFSIIRDAEMEKPKDQELVKRFRDAMVLFRARVELLSSLDHTTTQQEADAMSLMLETLLEGKRRLQHFSKRPIVDGDKW